MKPKNGPHKNSIQPPTRRSCTSGHVTATRPGRGAVWCCAVWFSTVLERRPSPKSRTRTNRCQGAPNRKKASSDDVGGNAGRSSASTRHQVNSPSGKCAPCSASYGPKIKDQPTIQVRGLNEVDEQATGQPGDPKSELPGRTTADGWDERVECRRAPLTNARR